MGNEALPSSRGEGERGSKAAERFKQGQPLPVVGSQEWILAGGFPCQDISFAGKGAGLDGARSGLWYEYARLIGEIRPRYAIMENVAALLGRGMDRVLGDMAAIGYDAEWSCIRASDVGAPHRRDRVWILAYPERDGKRPGLCQDKQAEERRGRSGHGGSEIPDAGRTGLEERDGSGPREAQHTTQLCDWWDVERGLGGSAYGLSAWLDGSWEKGIERTAKGVPERVNRLRCLGNSIVPQIAEMIFRQIAKNAENNSLHEGINRG